MHKGVGASFFLSLHPAGAHTKTLISNTAIQCPTAVAPRIKATLGERKSGF